MSDIAASFRRKLDSTLACGVFLEKDEVEKFLWQVMLVLKV